MKKLNVVLCGLKFGASFVPIYRDHPDIESVGIFDTDEKTMKEVSEHYHIEKMYHSFDEVLNDDKVDAVHLITPIPLHAQQSVQVLKSGKHCACTVPMGVTLEELESIIQAEKESGKKYMMMETTLYTRQFLYTKKLYENGEMGRIQFLRGSHYQDMENWPDYWMGLPPMHYGTHAIAPMVGITGSPIRRVVCFGSGTMRDDLVKRYQNPFPVESALFAFQNGLKGEATRSLFETARAYIEGMYVYGSKATVEWGFEDDSDMILTKLIPSQHRGFETPYETIHAPVCFDGLPKEIQQYTVSDEGYDATQPEEALKKGAAAGHHGSHPHLVNEFIRCLVEDRKPAIDSKMAANITAAGICAHLSALADGKEMEIPEFACF